MEENSMVFSVDSGEVSEDEDELQRREELHQLLSEQLQDDLLEDSISTATSLCLTPTPPHQHSNTSTPPYQHSITPVKADTSADMHTVPPVELAPTDSCDSPVVFPPEDDPGTLPPAEDWDCYTHISPQGAVGGQPQGGGHPRTPPSSTVGCGLAEGLTHGAGEGGDRETWGQADVFSGTSQAYGSSAIAIRREPAKVPAPPTPEYSAQQLEILYHARGRRIEMLSQQVSAQAEEGERHIRILRHEKGLLVEERDRLSQQVAGLEGLQHSLDREVAALRGQLGAEQSRSQALEGSQRELVSQLQAAEASVESLTNQVSSLEEPLLLEEDCYCNVSELTRTEAITRVRESYTSALAQSSHQHQQHTLALQHELDTARTEIERQNEAILQLQSQLQLQALPFVREESQSAEKSKAAGDPLAQKLHFGTTAEGAELEEESLMERVVELSACVEDLQFQLSTVEGALTETRERAAQAEAQLTSQATKLGALVAENQQLSLQLEDALREEAERRVLAEEDKRDALEKCRTACLQLHEDATQRLRGAATKERERAKREHAKQLSQIKAELAGVQEQYVVVCGEKEALCQQLEGRGEGVLSEGVLREWEEKKAAAVEAAVQEARSQWLAQQEETVAQAVGTARGKWVGQQEEAVGAAVEAARGAWQQRLLEESKASVEQALGAWQKEAELQLAKARQQWELEHKAEVKKVRQECGGDEAVEAAVLRAKQQWEREKEAAVTQAVREARSQWLKEREGGLGGRVEAAVAAAQQLWRAQQRDELERQRAGLQRAHSTELEQQRAGLERAHSTELERQRAGLEKEQRRAVQLAVKAAQEECESEGMVSLELALADERGRLQEESQRSWQKGRRSLLATAHREWTAAQEAVTRAEVKRARREWEEGRKEEVKVAVEEALSQARQHYEGVLVRGEGVRERERMAREIRQLEERVASLMRGQGSLPKVDEGTQTGARGVMDTAVVRELLQQTMAALRRDVQALLKDVMEASAAHSRQEALTASRASAREVQSYYLQCLHQLLNGERGGLLEAESNTRPSWREEDAIRRERGKAAGTAAPARRAAGLSMSTEQRTLAVRKAGKVTQELARTGSSRPKTSENPPTTAALKPTVASGLAASSSGVKRNLFSSASGARSAQKKAPSSHRTSHVFNCT